MKIAVGNDHAGLPLMKTLKEYLRARGHELVDHGTDSEDSVDYPDYAHEVAASVSSGKADLGLLVCGTGIGMSIAANRHPGVRAALCADGYMARMARMHNFANVLCMGARVLGPGVAMEILDVFLHTPFEGGRHERRVEKLEPKP
ncbi:MAG: ribose 5-phosphate isomerase B [Deltaproteobacteria bacterium]|nr:ribose 5-phosphate isomerase B [Deltaproteobacteria bacterium]